MKIHYVRLQHFRGVSDSRVDFAETGVTVVEGANEMGKTSTVEAIDLLLDEPDTSTKRAVKAVQPTNVDAGTEVEAEFSTGAYRFVYRKRWHKRQETTLQIILPLPEQLTGRRAHDRVRAILEETLDRGLWAALRVEQKKAIEQVALGGNDRLARALDAASGGARETGEESTLYERIEQEYLKYFTPNGKPTGEYRGAETEREKARADVDAAREAVREVERDIERHDGLQRELLTLAENQTRYNSDLVELEQRWQAVEQQRREIEDLRTRDEVARRDAADARAGYQRRQDLVGMVNAKAADLEDLRRAGEQAEPVLQRAEQLAEEAEAASAVAKEKADAAARQAQRAAEDLAHLRDRADLDDLVARRHRAAKACGASRKLNVSLRPARSMTRCWPTSKMRTWLSRVLKQHWKRPCPPSPSRRSATPRSCSMGCR
jgi:AAA domain